ncbi:aminobutyraldehyde dehydrogenase [Coxiella burnetii CbuK_Q154]|nr:aminobutyraldehyde dehydrogenase [Coxiella burnetii CbuK_Q154]
MMTSISLPQSPHLKRCEVLIIGGGIVGFTLARELIARGTRRLIIIEKESDIALHASGRNSGVLHAGVYYPPESLKAKLCLKGNKLMRQFCEAHQLYLNPSGKVIVTRQPEELPVLLELERRAKTNGANVEIIDEKQTAEIEPYAKTTEKALYSKDTVIVDPKQIMRCLLKELQATGHVDILFQTQFLSRMNKNTVKTTNGTIQFDLLINAAGAYADRVAHEFSVGQNYSFIPFKGIYKKLRPDCSHLVHGNIYPVPNIQNPFLGVHFTKSASGDVYLGPTAIPAFGRENYGLLKGIGSEALKIAFQNLILFMHNPKFRKVAMTEPFKYIKKFFFEDAKKLVKQLKPEWLMPTYKVGLRPQLVNWQTKELMMDFVIERNENTIHILNAISPAFTSSMAFADYVIQRYVSL